jgi:hypothetical protein
MVIKNGGEVVRESPLHEFDSRPRYHVHPRARVEPHLALVATIVVDRP